MTELLRNAWTGWSDYKGGGKLAALLLAVLLFLWLTGKVKEQAALLVYTTVVTVCCILPVTAVLLMLYQTRFYDYEWIWSMVPLTAVTAYGITLFLARQWGGFERRNWPRALPVTLLLLAALALCGSLGGDGEARKAGRAEREEAYRTVELLKENCPGENLCLWAPEGIMEYAREADASLRLIYGRNLWDISLDAYAYDTYDERTADLYQWMGWVERSSGWMEDEDREEMRATLEERVEDALERGANCILFPAEATPELVEAMEDKLGTEAQRLGEYLLFAGFQKTVPE